MPWRYKCTIRRKKVREKKKKKDNNAVDKYYAIRTFIQRQSTHDQNEINW